MTHHGGVIDIREREAERRQRTISNLVIALVLTAFFVAIVYAVVGSFEMREAVRIDADSAAYLATNPELMAARRYAAAITEREAAMLLRRNPELMVAGRYAEAAPLRAELALLHASPELNAHQSYQASVQRDAGFLAANPEIKVHQLFLAQTK